MIYNEEKQKLIEIDPKDDAELETADRTLK